VISSLIHTNRLESYISPTLQDLLHSNQPTVATLRLAKLVFDTIPSLAFSSHSPSTSPSSVSDDLPTIPAALPHARAFYSLSVDLRPPTEPDYPAFHGELLGRLIVEGLIRMVDRMASSDSVDEDGICEALALLEGVLSGEKRRRISWRAESWFLTIASLLAKVSQPPDRLIQALV
jgi:hypothetical protein